MEYKASEDLKKVAELYPEPPLPILSRSERLERWATLLEENPGRRLRTLMETEYQLPERRDEMRSDNSPISIAFNDPILRSEGMRDDTYGEAKRFFGMTDHQLHHVLCYCHFGATMTAETAARRVRALVPGASFSSVVARAWHALVG